MDEKDIIKDGKLYYADFGKWGVIFPNGLNLTPPSLPPGHFWQTGVIAKNPKDYTLLKPNMLKDV